MMSNYIPPSTVNEVAFVTAYLDIYHDDSVEVSRNRGIEWRLNTFQPLADTGIPIYLFYSQKYASYFEDTEYQLRNPNVIPFKATELENTWTWKIVQEHQPLQLPENRDAKKDTLEYMVLQNAKQEFIQQVMERYPHHTHYAWIDFSIVHMFKQPKESLEYLRVCYGLRNIPRVKPTKDTPQFFMPGCWPQQWFEPDFDSVAKRIHWRFCGSFFIASADSMQNFIRLYRHSFPLFMKEHRRMIWEVNFWAWLEVTNETLLQLYPPPQETPIETWKPTWYHSDHNDTIYRAPYWPFVSQPLLQYMDTHVQLLQLSPNLPPEKYPQHEQEWIGSSSFAYSPKHGPLLNTRVMNYWLFPNGYYRFTDPQQILRTRNLLSLLDEHGQPTQTYEVQEDLGISILQHHKPDAFSQGLEDVRIWVSPPANPNSSQPEILRFIATNVSYSPAARGRMITGELEIMVDENTQEWRPVFKHAIGIEPPRDTASEKNWIPLLLSEEDIQTNSIATSPPHPTEHFIYQWSPFQMGKVEYPASFYEDNTADDAQLPRPSLVIHTTLTSRNPFLFDRVRGSSPFLPFPSICPFPKKKAEKWLGVVHFSDEGHPRKYSHFLISLDGQGRPVRYSSPFSFCKTGVEFCIGFHAFEKEKETILRFWISRHDRDSTIVTTPFRYIPLEYKYPDTRTKSTLESSIAISTPIPEPLFPQKLETKETNIIPQNMNNMPTTPIHIFILCYNEELILPHTLHHYRTYLPHAYITIYDNESTDRSREIAEEWGCRVVSWNSENQQNEYIQQNIKNDVWKSAAHFTEIQIDPRPECSGKGWKLVVDMDEWVVVTEEQLAEEEAQGTTILRIKGVNVIGKSQDPQLTDVSTTDIHQWTQVTDWKPENKNLCFLAPPITQMNYTRGAHSCRPEGERVKYSRRIYYNKHMENLGLPFLIRKFTLRTQRNQVMNQRQINLHYTDDIAKLTERFESILQQSYVLESFAPIEDRDGTYVLDTDYHYN